MRFGTDETPVHACGYCGTTLTGAEPDELHEVEAISGKYHYATVCREYVKSACVAKERDLAALGARAEKAERQLAALRDQIAHDGCEAAHLGEHTYHCDATKPCGLCRMRERAEKAEQIVRLALFVCEARAEGMPYEGRLDKLHEALVGRGGAPDSDRELARTQREAARYMEALQTLYAGTYDPDAHGMGESLPVEYSMPPSTNRRVRALIRAALSATEPPSRRSPPYT